MILVTILLASLKNTSDDHYYGTISICINVGIYSSLHISGYKIDIHARGKLNITIYIYTMKIEVRSIDQSNH